MSDGHAFYLCLFIGLFVLIMFFGVYIQSVFGAQGADRLPTPPDFQYYYKTIGVKINEIKPEVCFFEPEDKDISKRFWKENWFGIGADALNEWKYNLQQETGVIEGWTWDYKIFLLQDHVGKSTKDLAFRECNIFVVYEKLSETGVIGQAASHYENSFHGYTFITVWTQTTTGGSTTIYLGESFNESKVIKNPGEVVDISKDNIGKILQHEFGHALGLEHQYRTLNGVVSNSIMVENLDITKENLNRFVTDNDIQAVILMYGEDGFGGWNNPIRERYIIIP